MAKKRYSHKRIKQDIKKDELRNLIERSADFAKSHTENLLISAIIVVVVIILIPLYFKNKDDNAQQAANMYNQALGLAMQPVSQDNTGQFKTIEEKYKQIGQQYSDIVANYKQTSAGRLARLGEANAAFYAKDYEKAQTLFQSMLTDSPQLPLRETVMERLANCYEQQEKWQAAADRYQDILNNHPNYFNQAAVSVHLAYCYAAMNDKEAASRLLAEQAEAGEGYWSQVAKRQLVLIEKE